MLDAPRSHHSAGELVLGPLRRLRARVRVLLIAREGALLGAAVLGGLLLAGLLDYALRTPDWFRVLAWFGGVGALVWAIRTRLLPALTFRPPLAELALRVEQAEPGSYDGLAAAADFAASTPADQPLERALAGAAVERVSHLAGFDTRAVAPAGALTRLTGALGVAVVVALVLGVTTPTLVGLGAQRLLTPWAGAAWPKRTLIEDQTAIVVHPRGTALPLTAELLRSPRRADEVDVAVRYEIRGGSDPSTRRELLTYQRGEIDGEDGAVFERLVDTTGDSIRYRFESGDDRTNWREIRLVPPPVVTAASVSLTPPEYVRTGLGDAAPPAVRIDLGTGVDERAIAPVVLAGSSAEIRIELNKPATLESITGTPLANTLTGEDADAVFETDGSVLTAQLTLGRSLRLALVARDEYDILSPDPAVFVFDVEEDAPATVAIVEPASDRRVLATALVDVRAEANDDVTLRAASLERQLWTRAEGTGPGGALEPAADAVAIAEHTGPPTSQVELSAQLDLSALELTAGDEVRLVAFARDLKQEEPTASATRTLLIIDEAQFVDVIRAELVELRQAAIRLDDQQAQLEQALAEDGATRATRRGQQRVGERVGRFGERIDQLAERVERNRLEDAALESLLEQAQEATEDARARAGEAAEVLDRAAARAPGQEPAELREDEQQQVEDAQRGVRDELARLASLLDRGEDAWAVRNAIERLRGAQEALRQDAAELEAQTAGRELDQLNEEERQQLDELAREQAELAERAEELERDLSERARDLSDRDQQTAAALQAAAERAEQNNLAERTQRASELAEENRLAQAGEQQEAVIESLEEMLEDIDRAERNQDDRLRRQLATLVETIRALIAEQEALLASLAEAGGQLPPGHAEALIVLNRNTLSAADEAGSAGPEAGAAAGALRRASAAQERAIASAREKPPEMKAVETQEERSLELLREALASAQTAQQRAEQRELERQRRELRQRYAEVLQVQIALVEDAEAFAKPGELGRRERVRLRRLGARQETIGVALAEILADTEGLAEASIFDFAHQRLEREVELTIAEFEQAEPRPALAGAQRVERGIRDLIEALRDPERDDEDFRDAGGGGGGGGGGGQQQQDSLILPLAELRLLRFVQQDLADRTTVLDGAGGGADGNMVTELAEQQRELAGIGAEVIEKLRAEQEGAQQGGF
ncbi:MAG: hypothetical protein AAGI30_05090 [Planctomycetota bacterium]